MKKEAEIKLIVVPAQTHELLRKACDSDPLKLTLGRMVTKLAYKEYGYLANEENSGKPKEDSFRKGASESAMRLLSKYSGNKSKAIASVSGNLPTEYRELVISIIENA